MSIMSFASSVTETCSWIEELKNHVLFTECQTEDVTISDQYLVCESRGDLFIYSPTHSCLLTTNLKRLHARRNEEHIYQKLHPTLTPITHPNSMLVSSIGQYLSLVGTNYINVLELRRQRGPCGEFAGGISETDCRTISVGSSLIRAHCLEVLHVQWHPNDDKTIAVLTSDELIRIYHISNPSVPTLSLNVLSRHSQSHAVTLEEDYVISFALSDDIVFLLLKSLEVQIISLKDGAQPSLSLPMYPLDKDNYSGIGCGLLLLPTQPLVLIIASANGVLHCVFAENDEDDIDDIYVIERIIIDDKLSNGIKLIPDPCAHNNYCVLTKESLYYIHIPWLVHLQNYSDEMPNFTPNPPATVNQLVSTDVNDKFFVDAVIVSDSLLGEAIIATYNDGTSWCFKNENQLYTIDPKPLQSSATCKEEQLPNEIFEEVVSLLRKSRENVEPLNIPLKAENHEECFKYLQKSIQMLRQRYVVPQTTINALLKGRVKLITQRYDRQMEELMNIEENIENEINNERVKILNKLHANQKKCKELTKRVELIYSQIANVSPVLSNDEKLMSKEIQSINDKLDGLNKLLQTAHSKVTIGLNRVDTEHSKLNTAQLNTVISSLTEDGKSIKELIQTIKQLQSFSEINPI